MLLGFPVVISILIPSLLYTLINGFPFELISLRIHYALDSFPLLAIPIFIFAGNLMNVTGLTKRIFKFADVSVGRVPGGMAQVNIFANLMFSGMTGSALAAVGGLGPSIDLLHNIEQTINPSILTKLWPSLENSINASEKRLSRLR
jgi:TRAP-type mannitol/chloroaromatic compound transport system permease large subunit